MLNVARFAEILIQEVSTYTSDKLSLTYLKVAKEYFDTNALITGNYVGVLTTNNMLPDPYSGPYEVKLTCPVDYYKATNLRAFLSNLRASDPNGWLRAMFSDYAPGNIQLLSPLQGISAPVIYQVSTLNVEKLREDPLRDRWLSISVAILNSFKNSVMSVPPIVTTSPSGVGLTTIQSVV